MITSLLCMLLLASAAQARHRDGDLERIRIEGRIESIRGQIAYVRDDCGATFRVHLGPAWYWDDHDYYLESGCWVTIVAWQDPFDDYCYAGEIRGDDFCYDLCDYRGYPRWRDRNECYSTWRPTRSFFEICFVINAPVWHCDRPRHRDHHGYDDCRGDRPRHRSWYSDNDDRDHHRGGRRDNDRGRRHDLGDNSGGTTNPPRAGFNSQVEIPRYTEKQPSRRDGGGSFRIEKPRAAEKVRVNTESRSKSGGNYNRKSSSSTSKTYARK